jgi:phage tail sheath gpL-like
MTIQFNGIPSTNRVPFVYVEFDASQAMSVGPQQYAALMLGMRTAATPVDALVPTLVTSLAQVGEYFGVGSQLYQMARLWYMNNTSTPLTIVALDDAAGAEQADGLIAFTGTASAAGTLALYVAGKRIAVGVPDGMTAAELADAVKAALDADPTLPVTADTVAEASVPVNCNWEGLSGNDIDLRLNLASGDATPAGITVTITAMDHGATNPDVDDAIAAIGDTQYNVIVNPFTDDTSLTALATEMARRDGPALQADGIVIMAYNDAVADLVTFGNAQNSQALCCVGVEAMPSPTYEVAAGIAAVAAYYLNIDPARPLQTLAVLGLVAPVAADRFTMGEQDLLLHNGISTFGVSADGTVRIRCTRRTRRARRTGHIWTYARRRRSPGCGMTCGT